MIFYYTGTGNSKYVAQTIAKSNGEELISIVDCIREGNFSFNIKENEIVGFVCPTYSLGMPDSVRIFLSKLKLNYDEKPYIFYLATYGNTIGDIKAIVSRYFKKIDAFFNVKMVDNWVPKFDLNDPEYIRKAESYGEKRLEEVNNLISSRKTGKYLENENKIFSRFIYKVGYEYIRDTSNLKLDDNCIGCGICIRNCPTNTIKMERKRPSWKRKKCDMCFACLHRCPQFAIHYGKKSLEHGQYLNPNVKL
ncbi:MAG: EFR1 family ferrodoxin [Methanobrevibacter sp.]|nr:EFR1 family ferrodoxin [Methanobrevibacter sp.]